VAVVVLMPSRVLRNEAEDEGADDDTGTVDVAAAAGAEFSTKGASGFKIGSTNDLIHEDRHPLSASAEPSHHHHHHHHPPSNEVNDAGSPSSSPSTGQARHESTGWSFEPC
jgi:hypothetical protein